MTPVEIEATIAADPKIQRYGDMLSRAGQTDREVFRAMAYVAAYGFGAMESSDCVIFQRPTCPEGWNCVMPEHQVLGTT